MAFLQLSEGILNIRTILVTTVALFVGYIFIVKFRRSSNYPPGPWGIPLFGYLPVIAFYSRFYGLPLPPLFLRLSKKYGSVFSIYLGDRLCVVLNSYEAIRDAFVDPKMTGRPSNKQWKSNTEATGIAIATGAEWKAQRAFALGVFRHFGLGRSVFEAQIRSELQSLIKEIDSLQGAVFDPTKYIMTTISNITSRVTVAKGYDYKDKTNLQLIHATDKIMKTMGTGGIQGIVKILRILPTKSRDAFIQAKKEFTEIIFGSYDERKKKYDSKHIECLVDMYLKKVEDKEDLGPSMNEQTIKVMLCSLYIAGTDTAAYQIAWILIYLLRFSETLRKVREEIDRVVGRDRLPVYADQPNLPITQATINECMRLCAPFPLGVWHAAMDDTTLYGYDIPKDALVVPNIWGIHNNPDVWTNPEEFNPDRFLDENAKLLENEKLIPFSTGM